MPYTKTSELPDAVQKLPPHAQDIYMSAFNSAFEQYKGEEAKAHATAWAAVETKFKKNKDGNWVAKESMTVESLKQEYTSLIYLAGSRNTTSIAKELQEVTDMVNRTMKEPNPSDSRVEIALQRVSEVSNMVKAMEVSKTEEGTDYPVSAFAYVPDPEKPSTWKLRLWEDPTKKITRSQLGKAAAALSPGGFRGQKVEIPAEDVASVKRKIRSAYKGLDVSDDEIPRWVKEAEMRTLVAEVIPLTEANVTSKGKGQVVVIQPGFNASKKRYYPKETLARDFKIFEKAKMFADHPTEDEDRARPERSIKDWVAVLENVRIRNTDGAVIGDYTVVEPWMEAKLAKLRDTGQLDKIGVSINAVGSATKQKIEGVETNFIERLVAARSVDFVTEPGAGGAVELFESNDNQFDLDLVDVARLRERRPDLTKLIEDSVREDFIKEARKKVELEEQVKDLTTKNADLVKENEGLKTRIAEADKVKVKADAQAKIKEAVDKAELPDAAKTKLTERFKDAESDTGVAEAIKAEGDYIKALAEAGEVRGFGNSKPNPEADHKALVESFKRTGMSDKEAEIAAGAR